MAIHSSFASVSCLTRSIFEANVCLTCDSHGRFPRTKQQKHGSALLKVISEPMFTTNGVFSFLCVVMLTHSHQSHLFFALDTILFSFLLLNYYSLNVVLTICSSLQLQVHQPRLKVRRKHDKNALLQMDHQHQTNASNDYKYTSAKNRPRTFVATWTCC